MITMPWLKFAGLLVVVASFFACYTLYSSNQQLREDKKAIELKLQEANANIELQKKLTKEALTTKDNEVAETQVVTKFVNKIDKVIVKENPKLAEDANKLWQEALLDE